MFCVNGGVSNGGGGDGGGYIVHDMHIHVDAWLICSLDIHHT
jgi:hypothetical protein